VVMIAAFHLTDQRQSRVQFPDSSTFAFKRLIPIVFVCGMGFRLDNEMRLRFGEEKSTREHLVWTNPSLYLGFNCKQRCVIFLGVADMNFWSASLPIEIV
jgi:hypothetical protein